MSSGSLIDPSQLGIKGTTQPELFDGLIQSMVKDLSDPQTRDAFWQQSLQDDGPIEIWEINGEGFLYNGNHRWHAAVAAGVGIPQALIEIKAKPGATVLTWTAGRVLLTSAETIKSDATSMSLSGRGGAGAGAQEMRGRIAPAAGLAQDLRAPSGPLAAKRSAVAD